MTRILLITDDYPPLVGGIATYLSSIYARFPDGQVAITSSRAALRSLRRVRPQVIHAGTLLPAGLTAFVLALVFRLPYAVHVYGTDLTTNKRSWLMQRVALTVLRQARRVITISDFSTGHAIALGVAKSRVVRILPRVDAHRFLPAPREPGRTLLTVARLVPRKGHDVVLRALALVLARMPDVQYRIAGDGPERARLERQAADLGVAHAVRFLGVVANVVECYQACDVFIMISREEEREVEGFGIASIEASACAKPVIAGRSGGVADAVIDGVTGLLVAPDDVDGVAAAILELLADPARCAQLGRQGRQRVLDCLQPEAAAAETAAVADAMQQDQR